MKDSMATKKPPQPPDPPDPPPRELMRRFAAALGRARTDLVPPAFAFLWQTPRFLVAWGGRASGKSWSIARVLLSLAYEAKLRILCCREIQSSVKESAYRLLADQVQILQLEEFFDIRADSIVGKNGSEFIFEGLRYNISRLRSLEGVNLCWIEEAQAVSERSWEDLIPTIRKHGSRFFISFNPLTPDDPVSKRFIVSGREDVIAKKVSFRDNPHLSPEVEAERVWLERTDIDAYRHVWEGEPRTVSDALILKGKYAVEPVTVNPLWAGPYHGLDYGFSRDPSAAVRCYIDDSARVLYIDREYWALGADIDALPGALEAAIPGISRHVVHADSARPESTSYLARNGIANARSAEKWSGSIDDGIAYLRSFARIVIDPACRHLIDEAGRYSFKCDRLTGVPLPEPIDAHNHLIDALRYALSPLIRNQPSGGFFNRAALLVKGEPLEPADVGRPHRVLVTIALCERSGSVGAVYWVHSPYHSYPFVALDYAIAEIEQTLNTEWLRQLYARAQDLRAEWNAVEPRTCLWAEEGDLYEALEGLVEPLLDPLLAPQYQLIDVGRLESKTLVPTLDERATAARADVNAGRYVKVARAAYGRQATHRSVTAGHLMNQVLAYKPGNTDVATELVQAFLLAFAFPGEAAPQEIESTVVRAQGPAAAIAAGAPFARLAPPVAAPSAPTPWRPTIPLTAGRHVIDGATVDVPRHPSLDRVQWELAPGKHIVDGKIVIIPGRGLKIGGA
jgi:phage terminase large subunit